MIMQTQSLHHCDNAVPNALPPTSALHFTHDIVLGRGSSHSWRPGNALFHKVLDAYSEAYHTATKQCVKSQIVETIYEQISLWGRFLEKDPTTNIYTEIGKGSAKRRIGQAIRYRKRRVHRVPAADPGDLHPGNRLR